MKIKQLFTKVAIVYCLVLVSLWMSTIAYAAGAQTASIKNGAGIYIEGLAGYNRYALKGIANPKDSWSHGTGNWAFGGALGYQFCQYFSTEIGGIYTLHASARNPSSVNPSADEKIQPWAAYLAGKLSLMIDDKTNIFTKLGWGYQRLKVTNGPFGTEKLSNWGAVFGAGIAYHFTSAVYTSLQWLRFTGKIVDGVGHTTAPNIFLLGVGYKF